MSRTVFYAYPQDWIRVLGSSLVKVRARHEPLDRTAGGLPSRHIADGSVDWMEVRRALEEIPYDGWVTAEIAADEAASLEEVATALRQVL